MIKNPSEVHPDLINEHIDKIGRLIFKAREENLEASDDRDDGWSLGCRAYSWCRSEISSLADQENWLKVIDPNLRFIFSIGRVEISLYKGASTKPKKNIYCRVQSYPEIKQLSLINSEVIPDKLIWAYAVETDLEGQTTGIEFFGMDEAGVIIASRQVPIHQVSNVVVSSIASNEPEAVELPPASVSLAGATNKESEVQDEQQSNLSRG